MKQKQFIQNCMQSYMKNYQHYLTGETNKIYDYTIHLLLISLGVCRDLNPCLQVPSGYFCTVPQVCNTCKDLKLENPLQPFLSLHRYNLLVLQACKKLHIIMKEEPATLGTLLENPMNSMTHSVKHDSLTLQNFLWPFKGWVLDILCFITLCYYQTQTGNRQQSLSTVNVDFKTVM